MRTTGLMVVLAITVALMVGIACDGPNPSERPESNVSSAAPVLGPTTTSAATAVPGPVSPHRQLTALPGFWSRSTGSLRLQERTQR